MSSYGISNCPDHLYNDLLNCNYCIRAQEGTRTRRHLREGYAIDLTRGEEILYERDFPILSQHNPRRGERPSTSPSYSSDYSISSGTYRSSLPSRRRIQNEELRVKRATYSSMSERRDAELRSGSPLISERREIGYPRRERYGSITNSRVSEFPSRPYTSGYPEEKSYSARPRTRDGRSSTPDPYRSSSSLYSASIGREYGGYGGCSSSSRYYNRYGDSNRDDGRSRKYRDGDYP